LHQVGTSSLFFTLVSRLTMVAAYNDGSI